MFTGAREAIIFSTNAYSLYRIIIIKIDDKFKLKSNSYRRIEL